MLHCSGRIWICDPFALVSESVGITGMLHNALIYIIFFRWRVKFPSSKLLITKYWLLLFIQISNPHLLHKEGLYIIICYCCSRVTDFCVLALKSLLCIRRISFLQSEILHFVLWGLGDLDINCSELFIYLFIFDAGDWTYSLGLAKQGLTPLS